MPKRSIVSSLPVAWPTSPSSENVSHTLRAASRSCVVCFANQVVIHLELEGELARLRQEKEQLSRELADALESGRRAGEELGRKDRELSGNTCCLAICRLAPLCSLSCQK